MQVKGTHFTQTVLAKDFAADSTDAEGVVARLDSSFNPRQRRLVHRHVAQALAQRPRLLPGAVLTVHQGGIHAALRQDSSGNLVLEAGRDAQRVLHSYVRAVSTTVLTPAPAPEGFPDRLLALARKGKVYLLAGLAGLGLVLLLILRFLRP